MAIQIVNYVARTWENGKGIALNADNLNVIERGIERASSTLNEIIKELDSKANSLHRHDNASPATDGFISSTDKKKLDSVEQGANKTTIIDNVTTSNSTAALSAKQGKLLAASIEALSAEQSATKESLETLKNSIVPALEWNSY